MNNFEKEMEIDAAAIKFNELTEKLHDDFIIRKEALIRKVILTHGLTIDDIIVEENSKDIRVYKKSRLLGAMDKITQKWGK